MSTAPQLSGDEIADGITKIACRVLAVLLADGNTVIAMDGADLAPFVRHDVVEILKLRNLPPFRIAALVNWSPMMTQLSSPRDRDALIALVIGICS